jgi:hypothetical protein
MRTPEGLQMHTSTYKGVDGVLEALPSSNDTAENETTVDCGT